MSASNTWLKAAHFYQDSTFNGIFVTPGDLPLGRITYTGRGKSTVMRTFRVTLT